jgi:chromosome partitioning protein
MHVVAVVNRKGGVGKTTTAVNVAAALALAGQRTLLIDLDPQGSVARALGMAAVDGDGTGSSAAFRSRGRMQARYAEPPELFRLGVVVADDALGEEEHDLLGDVAKRARLRRSLDRLRDHWSVVVLDTPPALGGLNDAAMRAADAVLVPAAADYLAVEALRGTLDAVRRVEKARGTRYAPLAILPTFVDARRSGARAAEALLREAFADLVLDASVPVSARFDTAALTGVPVVLSAPRTTAAIAYRAAAREVLARMSGKRSASGGRRKAVKGFVRSDMRGALQELRRVG